MLAARPDVIGLPSPAIAVVVEIAITIDSLRSEISGSLLISLHFLGWKGNGSTLDSLLQASNHCWSQIYQEGHLPQHSASSDPSWQSRMSLHRCASEKHPDRKHDWSPLAVQFSTILSVNKLSQVRDNCAFDRYNTHPRLE